MTWTVELALDRSDKFMEGLAVPKLKVDPEKREDIVFMNLSQASNKQLEDYLSASGAWTAYLDLQLSNLSAKKGAYETAYEAGLAKALSLISAKYKDERKPNRESLVGEILIGNEALNSTLKTLIEVRAAYDKVLGLRTAYHGLYQTVSRIISLRALERQVL